MRYALISLAILINVQPPDYINQPAIELDADLYHFGEVTNRELVLMSC